MSWKAQARRLINRSLEPAGFTLRRFLPDLRFIFGYGPANLILLEIDS